jgi:glycosyltransferase involved in cell wall biosynthesis
MNIAFVCHGNATSQSTYHVLSIAEKLGALGHHCIVCIPSHQHGDLSKIRATAVPVRDFAEVGAAGLQFPDGQGPTLIHCWTAREQVRQFADGLLRQYDCRYFVHLEDNEREILHRELAGISYEELALLPPDQQDAHIPHPLLRIHPSRHWEFLHGAAGCTVLVERLREHVPDGVPVQLFWPGYDDCFATAPPQASKEQLRKQHGIAPDRFVVLYAGAIHTINYDEICRMVTALKILVNRGMPLTLVKTGHNDYPDLLHNGVLGGWIREMGFLPRERLPELYALADVLIQPGRSDPFNDYRFPSKLPEALAQKLPVILPRCNIGLELEDGVEALITEDDSMERLIEKIVYLYADPAARTRIGESGWQFCQRHLSWDKAAGSIASFYETCLATTTEPPGRDAARSAEAPPGARSSQATDPATAALGAPIAPEDLYLLFQEERDFKGKGSVLADVNTLRHAVLSTAYTPQLARLGKKLKKYKLLYVLELVIILLLLAALYRHG